MYNITFLAILLVVGGYAYYYYNSEKKIDPLVHFGVAVLLLILIGAHCHLYWKHLKNKGKKSIKNTGTMSVNVPPPPHVIDVNSIEDRPPQSHISSPDMPYPMREGDVNIPSDATPYGRVRLINYHADWCPHSKSFLPFWTEFANQVRVEYPFVGVFDIQCSGPEQQKCQAAGIDGFPTVVLNIANRKIEYKGTRNIVAMMAWLRNNLETAGIY